MIELKIDFYRGGLRLQFAQGKLVSAETWQAPAYRNAAYGGYTHCVRCKRPNGAGSRVGQVVGRG